VSRLAERSSRHHQPPSARNVFALKSAAWPFRRTWAIGHAVAVLYFAVASLSLRLAFEKTNASPVWPAIRYCSRAVLLLGYRIWPAIMLGSVFANVVAFLGSQAAGIFTIVSASAVIRESGNALEAVVGVFLVRRWIDHDPRRYPIPITADAETIVKIPAA